MRGDSVQISIVTNRPESWEQREDLWMVLGVYICPENDGKSVRGVGKKDMWFDFHLEKITLVTRSKGDEQEGHQLTVAVVQVEGTAEQRLGFAGPERGRDEKICSGYLEGEATGMADRLATASEGEASYQERLLGSRCV